MAGNTASAVRAPTSTAASRRITATTCWGRPSTTRRMTPLQARAMCSATTLAWPRWATTAGRPRPWHSWRQPGHRRRQCQCHEPGHRPARVAARGERQSRHRRRSRRSRRPWSSPRSARPTDAGQPMAHHGRAGRPGRQPGRGGQRRRDGHACSSSSTGRQLLVSPTAYPITGATNHHPARGSASVTFRLRPTPSPERPR